MQKEIILTKEGYDKLVEELSDLVSRRRKEVAERIKESIAFGDLSENSEYDDAKNEQAFIEGRITEINEIISEAKVVEENHRKRGMVDIGCRVLLKDLESGEECEYRLVGSVEANPGDHKISNESPVGQAIVGKKAGQTVEVKVPSGSVQYQIVSVKK
ncbi:MAG: transcription elongation factor GreA [Actinobacteria bacterium]|nr:MAG: transcription elongation factor GreA [Actinomycetota bacterium]